MLFGINFEKFIQPTFWLESRPGDLSTQFEIFFLAILIIAYGLYVMSRYIQAKLIERKNKLYARWWTRFGSFSISMAISFTFIFFFRYEGIPILGGRYWFLLWAIVGAIWMGTLLYRYYKVLPQKVREREERLQKQKYIK